MALSSLHPKTLSKTVVLLFTLIFLSKTYSFAITSDLDASAHSQQAEANTDKSQRVEITCTELTSRAVSLEGARTEASYHEERKKTAYVCENFWNNFSTEIFHWIVRGDINDRMNYCVSPLKEDLIYWYSHCMRLQTTQEYIMTSTSGLDVNENCSTFNRTKVPKRYVDFLFLIEEPKTVNVNASHQLAKAVGSLANALDTKAYNVVSQFAFIFYALDGKGYSRVGDFSPNVSELVEYLRLLETKNRDSETTEKKSSVLMNKRLLHHKSVSENLQQVSHFLALKNGEEIELRSQDVWSTNTLSHRYHADLHILSFMDLSNKNVTSENNKDLRTDNLFDKAKESIQEHFTTILDDFQTSSDSNHKMSLHFFFSPSNSAARSYLGDPTHSVRYSDCSHFNKALTLKALLSSKHKIQSDSLQAHLLSQGVEMQVHTWKDLLKKDCINGVTPTLFTPSGLEYRFTNACQECTVNPKDFHKLYCSPLHGWMVKNAAQSKNKGELFEGKTPLSGQFMASHADLLEPAKAENGKTSSVRLPLVQLTVNKELGTNQKSHFEPVIEGHPHIMHWSPEKPFVSKMISRRKPTVLRNTVVQTWPALKKWNITYIEKNMGMGILPSVKCTNSFLTFDPDQKAPLKLNISLPFVPVNMTTESFFSCFQRDASDPVCSDGYKGHYYFGSVPELLKDDVQPDRLLYHTEKDYKAKRQFMWISSAGMITHTHFDQDFNFFVQLVGKKRFTLWSPEQHELMYVYPRVHPMWHKSRVNYRAVDLNRFPAFLQARGKQIELGPGDMLFVPPYTWHYVETLTPSVSLSTWSHDYNLYDHMNSIYRHDHKFDLLEDSRGQMFVLRLYLDMMVHSLYGFNQTTRFFVQLVNNRYSDLEHLFPASEDDPEICSAAVPGKIPTCIHVHGYAKLDMTVIGSHFEELRPEVRDVLFQDYVEEITAQVVGVKKMLAFFRYCFLGQDYYVTDIDSEEHLLWEHKELNEDE